MSFQRIIFLAATFSVFTLMLSVRASADTAMTGNELLDFCGTGPTTETATVSAGMCVGYVEGVYEALTDSGTQTVCPNNKVTVEQFADIVTKFLTEHPEIRDKHATVLIAVILEDNFPCPKLHS
jgi:hypothetical protein